MAELHFPLHGPSVDVVRRCGPALSQVLQSKFECVAVIEGVDFEGDLTAQQRRPTVVQEKRFEAKLPSGLKISVWRADLTDFRAEAVVNAANVDLQHCGGLAAALSHAGGPQIKRESEDYIKRHGPLQTGEAIVTNAGSLRYTKIIHAVGPDLPMQPSGPEVSQAVPRLRKAIRSILDRVEENHLKNVAIPAISSGLFHFPLPLCAEVIVSTVKEYYDGSSFGRHRPEEIFLVNNDEPSVREMEKACHRILASHKPMMYSQAAAGKTSRPPVQMGKVRVILKWGRIEEQQTDVIVNTTSSDRDLKHGKISSALLNKAGNGIQKEIYEAKPKGKIIITKGYSLPCAEVFHTFCTEKEHTEAQQILFKSVLECLWMAATNKHKSIAFPAIGTGFKFTKREAAEIMSHAVTDFAQKCSTMMEVHFVIFPRDNDTFQAFEEQMRILKQNASHPSFTEAFEHREELRDREPPTPQISLSGPSDEATREAERWLSGLFKSSCTVTIRNNFIQHFGKKEFAQLSRLTKYVFIDESFKNGHAEITVNGKYEDAVVAGLQVEELLCNIQREFVKEEEDAMFMMSMKNLSFERKTVDHQNPRFSNKFSELQKKGLWMLKLETVQNPTLETLFNLKKKQLQRPDSRRMFQRIPAQFCGMVGHIGFQREYAPPAVPAYGEGIYFAGTLQKAMEMWKEQNEEYLYLVEADVLTGYSTSGKPGLILPPAVGTDPKIMYDSVSGGPDISVIFSSYQALPRYIITCKVIM